MTWHVLGYVAWMLGSAFLADLGRAYLRGRSRRQGTWAGITAEAEARRLERERELAPFLPEARREVDAMLPGTPPIAPPVKPPVLPPAFLPAPALPADVSQRVAFEQQLAGAQAALRHEPAPVVDAQKMLRDAWIVEESFHPTPARWARLDACDLVAAYWEARRLEALAKPGSWVLGSMRREMERRFGKAAVEDADRRPA